MSSLHPYTQKQLNEIWDSFATDSPYPAAQKHVDDDTEQVMTITEVVGGLSVSRRPGGIWERTKYQGEDRQFE